MSTQTVLQAPVPIEGSIRDRTIIPQNHIPIVCAVLLDIHKDHINSLAIGDELDDIFLWLLSNSEDGASFVNCCKAIGISHDGMDDLREKWCGKYLEKIYGKGKKGRNQIVSVINDHDGDVCKAVLVQILAHSAQGKSQKHDVGQHQA